MKVGSKTSKQTQLSTSFALGYATREMWLLIKVWCSWLCIVFWLL